MDVLLDRVLWHWPLFHLCSLSTRHFRIHFILCFVSFVILMIHDNNDYSFFGLSFFFLLSIQYCSVAGRNSFGCRGIDVQVCLP